MARRVITYDEAFEIIENCKPKDMDLYLEAAAKENAIGIYTEMHNYINDNIVTLDYDVDLFTEAFSWDKSKGFWANIWAWICNVWDAFKQFFMSFFGKNEMISKEAAEKIKSTAESAASKVENNDIQLDSEGIKALNELFEYMGNLDSKVKEEIDKIDKDFAEVDVKKDKKRQVYEQVFERFYNTIKSLIGTKGLIKNPELKKQITDFLNALVGKYNQYDQKILESQKKRNMVISSIGRVICAYTNVMTVLGGIIKHEKLHDTNTKKIDALESIQNLLKIDTNSKTLTDQGTIMQVILIGIQWLTSNVLSDAATNFNKEIEIPDYSAIAGTVDMKNYIEETKLEFTGTLKTEYDKVIQHYATINKDIELTLPGVITETMTLKVNDLPSSDQLRKNPVTDENVKSVKDPDNQKAMTALKESIPKNIKAVMHCSTLFVNYKMAGKAFLEKVYKLIEELDKAGK